MPNPNQTDPIDGMIARIEEANARAYEQFASASERALKSEQESTPQPQDQPDLSAAPKRESSRARPLFFVLIGLLLTASACVTAFAWDPSYGDAAKLVIARWANARVLQTVPLAQTPRDSVPVAPLISPEIAQRLQRAADDLANVERQIEQLKASQEQIVRDNARVVEQLNASLAQTARQNAAITLQLKELRAQLADTAAANPARRRRQ
jgi:hypothetical protein